MGRGPNRRWETVTAPEGVLVEVYDYESTRSEWSACGYSWPYNGEGCETSPVGYLEAWFVYDYFRGKGVS